MTDNQKYFEELQPHFGNKLVLNIQYEPDLEDVKNNPNKIWDKYQMHIDNIIRRTVKRFAIDDTDMKSDMYMWFIQACKKYKPMYINKEGDTRFIPAQNFILNYINNYMMNYPKLLEAQKGNRSGYKMELILNKQVPNCDYELVDLLESESNDFKFDYELNNIINEFPDNYIQLFHLLTQDKKQKEIGEIMGRSQGWIALMLLRLRQNVENADEFEDKEINHRTRIAKCAIELYKYLHDYNGQKFIKKNSRKSDPSKDKRLKANKIAK